MEWKEYRPKPLSAFEFTGDVSQYVYRTLETDTEYKNKPKPTIFQSATDSRLFLLIQPGAAPEEVKIGDMVVNQGGRWSVATKQSFFLWYELVKD
jgi:hypothetical protein